MSAENTYIVKGDLTFSTVPKLTALGEKYIDTHHEPTFDFAAVQKTDSSAIALLLFWLREAKKDHKKIHFDNIPPQVIEVAEVCGVSALMNDCIRSS